MDLWWLQPRRRHLPKKCDDGGFPGCQSFRPPFPVPCRFGVPLQSGLLEGEASDSPYAGTLQSPSESRTPILCQTLQFFGFFLIWRPPLFGELPHALLRFLAFLQVCRQFLVLYREFRSVQTSPPGGAPKLFGNGRLCLCEITRLCGRRYSVRPPEDRRAFLPPKDPSLLYLRVRLSLQHYHKRGYETHSRLQFHTRQISHERALRPLRCSCSYVYACRFL